MSGTLATCRLPLLVGAGVVGAASYGAAQLWAHFGTAVFFEAITAGLAGCFG